MKTRINAWKHVLRKNPADPRAAMELQRARSRLLYLKKLSVPVLLIIIAALLIGCVTTRRPAPAPARRTTLAKPVTPPLPPVPKPNAKIAIRKPSAYGNGNGGNLTLSAESSAIFYGEPCTNVFAICHVAYFPCDTNEFESFDVPEDPSYGRWFSGTNVVSFWAEPGWIYVPEFLVGPDWLSNCVINGVEAPGVFAVTNLHYLEYGNAGIYRIAAYPRPETAPP